MRCVRNRVEWGDFGVDESTRFGEHLLRDVVVPVRETIGAGAMPHRERYGIDWGATSRDDAKLRRALDLGTDHAINGRSQDVGRQVRHGADRRSRRRHRDENVGAAVWSSALKSVVRGGRIVTCGATTGDQPPADLRRLFIRQIRVLGSTLGDPCEFQDLLNVCERGMVRPVIDSTYSLDNIHAALDRLESGDQFGKIAIAIA